jgi:hypothetical protein
MHTGDAALRLTVAPVARARHGRGSSRVCRHHGQAISPVVLRAVHSAAQLLARGRFARHVLDLAHVARVVSVACGRQDVARYCIKARG